jgi:transcriptional regulator with XRE-family HTH domain
MTGTGKACAPILFVEADYEAEMDSGRPGEDLAQFVAFREARKLLLHLILMTADDFGPQLRAEREARNITLAQLAVRTKVSVELWHGLERNDFSRWPSGVFARAFVRDYAQVVGLDPDAVVNDFCRLFPIGDRRGARIVRAKAEMIGHEIQPEPAEFLPAGRERRQARPVPGVSAPMPSVYRPRILAAGIDLVCVASLVLVASALVDAGVLALTGFVGPAYYATSTIASGSTPGIHVIDALRHRAPALFASRRTVSA